MQLTHSMFLHERLSPSEREKSKMCASLMFTDDDICPWVYDSPHASSQNPHDSALGAV